MEHLLRANGPIFVMVLIIAILRYVKMGLCQFKGYINTDLKIQNICKTYF